LSQVTAECVEAFDIHRRACLYLTYHGHGDTRQRRDALLSFTQACRAAAATTGRPRLVQLTTKKTSSDARRLYERLGGTPSHGYS
jgi:hypothetical protein